MCERIEQWCYDADAKDDLSEPLLPGYVIVVTRRPVELSHALRTMSDFALLLAAGKTFVPLREDERAWMEEFTEEGKRMGASKRPCDMFVQSQGR